jgi:chaperone BCS1
MTILEFALATSIFASVIALLVAGVTGIITSFILGLPRRLWQYVVKKVTFTVTFESYEPGFEMLKEWLAVHPYAKRARNVKMVFDSSEARFVPVPGHGSHFLWFEGPVWIKFHEREQRGDAGGMMSLKSEQYSVTIIAKTQSKVERFMNELSRFKKQEVSALTVYTWRGGYWNWSGRKRKRDMNTVYMPASTKAEIIDCIKRFRAAEEWYAARGIPWRLGILFKGGPGTGKTTLATALAGHFDLPLYSMNLETIGNDETLLHSFSSAQRDGVILIEDVDGFQAAHDRGNIEREESATTPNDAPPSDHLAGKSYDEILSMVERGEIAGTPVSTGSAPATLKATSDQKKVTISGLLNAIDGVAATDGRILILTTNDVSKLDPALLRSGRIDFHFEIGHLTPDDVVAMFKCFYPDAHHRTGAIREYARHRSKTAAAWQKLFIKYHDSVENLFAEVIDA